MERHFERFVQCLIDAGSKMDKPEHFLLPEAGGRQVMRERVYCHEFYRQLENALEFYWPDFPYELHGDVDKRGHPEFRDELKDTKPDFIVHVPGRMDRNLVVIEVKTIKVEADELRKDIGKLKKFVEEKEYYRAIMLIYSDGEQKLPAKIVTQARSLIEDDDRILLMWHPGPKRKLELCYRFARQLSGAT